MDLGVNLHFLCTGMAFQEPRLEFYAQAWGLRSLGGVSGVDLGWIWIWGGSGMDLGRIWGGARFLSQKGANGCRVARSERGLMHRHGV